MIGRLSLDDYASRQVGKWGNEQRRRAADARWAARYVPALEKIVGPVRAATFEEDSFEATDFLVFDLDSLRLAFRAQRSESAFAQPTCFRLRLKRDRGTLTEVPKIRAGWGDVLFFGHVKDDGFRLWTLLNLHVFRREERLVPMRAVDLRDGTHMAVYDMRSFSHDLIIAQGKQ